ncbi:MAG: Gfo/Idh/MocA family oxidoreductase [Pseudolabrys sp.]|nr:Gfo/Idh/MocA family oxidoreductase [Pseudolabrys sp.]
MKRKLRIGVAGLGRGFTFMLPTFARDARVALVGAADTRATARQLFAREFQAKTFDTVEALCADPEVEVVYVATPHQFHAQHASAAARAGKHLLIEKPMAIALSECDTIMEAVRKANIQLVVGHSHSFDAPYARARAMIDSGEFGSVRMITALNFTDFVYRPRRPEEMDTAKGGGAIFSQAAHQVDIVRLLAAARVTSVRAVAGDWDRARSMDGAYAAFLTFEHGATATLTYSGYGNFASDEWQGWIGEMGQKIIPRSKERLKFSDAADEATFKQSLNYGGENYRPAKTDPAGHHTFGTVIVSCERADVRPLPSGVMVYRQGASAFTPLPAPTIPRIEVIDELYDAVVNGVTPKHDGQWAKDTLDVCLAMSRSSQEGREINLKDQN